MIKTYWKLLAFCLAAAVIVDEVWARVISQVALSTNSPGPGWIGRVSLWMPGGVGLRIANLFGYRFEVSRWDEMGPLVLITGAIGSIVWACVLFGFALLIRRAIRSRVTGAAA